MGGYWSQLLVATELDLWVVFVVLIFSVGFLIQTLFHIIKYRVSKKSVIQFLWIKLYFL